MTLQIVNLVVVLMGIYIALSITCSFLQEQVAAILKLRAKSLADGLAQLVARDEPMLKSLLTHPLIAEAPADGSDQKHGSLPSYVDPRNFSLAFWQTVNATATQATSPAGKAIANPSEAFEGLITSVNAWSPLTLSGERIKQSAVALLNNAEGDYAKLLTVTDAWFNTKMDRISGWYKRQAQYVMVVIAFALAFGAGIDSIALGRELFASPAFTQAIADSITTSVEAHKSENDGGMHDVAQIVADAQSADPMHLSRWSPATTFDLQAFFGLLITAVAVSLGAPFWFDVLQSVVNVRMAGAKPDDSRSQATSSDVRPVTQYVVPLKLVDNGASVGAGDH